MPNSCAIRDCDSFLDEIRQQHFQFPKDPNLRKLWIGQVQLSRNKVFQTTANSVICAKHFQENDFVEQIDCQGRQRKRKRLSEIAVPSKFLILSKKKTRIG